MEGVEIGNEIWVWAGRNLTTDYVPHAKAPRRKEPISTDYADFRRLGQTPKYILMRLTGLTGFVRPRWGREGKECVKVIRSLPRISSGAIRVGLLRSPGG
jgi:hypothetical protein